MNNFKCFHYYALFASQYQLVAFIFATKLGQIFGSQIAITEHNTTKLKDLLKFPPDYDDNSRMKTINRLRTFFLIISLASVASCLPDSFTKFEEAPANSTEAPTNDGGTSPTIPGAGTSSCTGTAAECYGPSDVRYEDQVFDLDAPGSGSNFGPTIIGNDVPVEQLNFSLKSVLPAGLGFNPNTGEFFGTPIDYFNDTIEVHITHPNTGKTFVRTFNLEASREITSIEYHIPLNSSVILKISDEEEGLAQFNITQSIVTENGTKAKIDYIDPESNEIHVTVTKAGPISIGDKIDNNAFFVSEKAVLSAAVIAIDKQSASSEIFLKLKTDPDLSSLTEEEKAQVLSFTTDPTDKVDDSDQTGLQGEFYVCDDPDNNDCNGDSFGALVLHSGKIQEEKTIQVQVETLNGTSLNSVVSYRVLPFAKPKSITKVVYPQKPFQKLILKLSDEDQAAAFEAGGWVSNERGAKATVNFIAEDELFVTIHSDSSYYFEPGDKLDNEENFFFEEADLPISETDSSVTYVFPLKSGSVDPETVAGNDPRLKANFFLRPEFFFPDGKTKLFDDGTAEEAQVRFAISPNPSTKEPNITYGSDIDSNGDIENLAGSYTFDFCDHTSSNNGKFDAGSNDEKNIPESECSGTFYPSGSKILNDDNNADGGLFSFSFCDDQDRIYESSDSITVTDKEACDALGSKTWHTAGLLALGTSDEIESTMEPQIFQVSVKNALGNEHKFIFKMSFDAPPEKLSLNKYLLVPVNSTKNFDIGDYISTSAPPESTIDCRNSTLALSLQQFGGTFSAISQADALITNEDFWNCGVGIVTDIFDSTRTIYADTILPGSGDVNGSPRKYHSDASNQKYLGIKIIKGRFVKDMSIDNVKIFSSEKTKIKRDPIPYNINMAVSSATNLNELLDNSPASPNGDQVFDRVLDLDPTDDLNKAYGQVVAAFEIADTAGLYKILVRTTPDQESCSNPALENTGGDCRFITDTLHRIEDPVDGSALASDVRLEFIQSEAVFINTSAEWQKGDELTTDPADPDIDGNGRGYNSYLVSPLNAVVMDHPDTAGAQNFELFVRNGAITDTTAALSTDGQRGLMRNSNPFNGSKYYYSGAAPHSENNEGTDDPDDPGDELDSPFGTSDSNIEIVSQVKSSNIFYLYKDDPVLIKSYVQASGNTVFKVSPELPGGLFLDPTNGEIRGAPKGKSDPQVYTVTAVNPFGSTTSYFTIEVMEYFGIELFATETEPFSYILHKEGQANEVTQCRVLKKQIERAQNAVTFDDATEVKKLVDIGCWLDAGERDLYEKGINLAIRIPNNTCEYVVHEPYQFYAFKPGKTVGYGHENSKLIYEHETSDLGVFDDDGIAEAWQISGILNPGSGGTPAENANRTIHVGATVSDVEDYYKRSSFCGAGGVTNGWTNAGTNYGVLDKPAHYPELNGAKNQGTDPNDFGSLFPTNSSDIDDFEYPNGNAVENIFGSLPMQTASDAAKFACSYNYQFDDKEGPKCDTGKVSVRKVKWTVGGGRCYVDGYGFFDVDNGRVKNRVADNSYDGTHYDDFNQNSPCKDFDLAGTGLKCETDTDEADAAFEDNDEACSAHNNLVDCLKDAGDANHKCIITDGDEFTKNAEADINSFCHIPAFVTINFSEAEEDNSISECGGAQNNCLSGPAVEHEDFPGIADGQLLSVVHNVVKEDGFDSLGSTTFEYSSSRNAKLGSGDDVAESVGHLVTSNIYLSNYIGHPEPEDDEERPNYGALCAFRTPSSEANLQPTQYDIDAMVRGLGFQAYRNNGALNDVEKVNLGYQGISDTDLIAEPFYGSRPYYGYKCVDSADNVVARIRLVVRDWNKTFKPSDHTSFVSPDLGHCEDGVAGADITVSGTGHLSAICNDGIQSEEGLMDNNFDTIYDSTTYNDFKDWDDFGIAKDEDATSCFNLNMREASNNQIEGKVCFGQCVRDADGACIGDGTTAECWDRTDPDLCLFDELGNSTGCILSNFPAFNY